MRCPKCHYLSFEPEPRCRNCGYGFSLTETDLLIRTQEPTDGPLADLVLREAGEAPLPAGSPGEAAASGRRPGNESVGPFGTSDEDVVPDLVHRPRRPAPARRASTTELPLFVRTLSADPREDGASSRVPVRPPLAVRRRSTTPAASRKIGPLDRDLLADLHRSEAKARTEGTIEARAAPSRLDPSDRAGAGRRLAAASLDTLLMGSVALAVLLVTLRWCDLPLERAAVLPVAPTGGFLLLVAVGYVLMFTAAAGQTIGKMAFGLRVVGDAGGGQGDEALTFRQAVSRAFLMLPSVLVLGAGFVPALVGDERALHDRLAHTRVVRV